MTYPSRTAEYHRDVTRAKAYGTWEPYLDAEPARLHVLYLRREGMGLKTIAAASGVPHGSLAKLIYGDNARGLGPSKRVRPETAAAILAVEPTPIGRTTVDPETPRLQLRALVAIGWSQATLGKALGLGGNINSAIHGRKGIGANTAHRIADLYAALSMVPGPSSRARDLARKHGWSPPIDLEAAS